MHWVIQDNLFREKGIDEMIECLDRLDIPYSLVKVVPFTGDMEPDLNLSGPVVCFGSYGMRRNSQRKGWLPGVFDLGPVTYDIQKQIFPGRMLNDDLVVCRFADILDHIGDDPVFVRPVADSKDFAGGVMDRTSLEPWVKSVCEIGEQYGDKLEADTLVMVAKPKKILQEARFWIVDGRVVTQSYYKFGDHVRYSPDVDRDLVWEAGALSSNHPMTIQRDKDGNDLKLNGRSPLLPDAYVMDLARLEDGSIKIVELNTFNAAGLYAANVGAIVCAVEALNYKYR